MLITIKQIKHENKVGRSGKLFESCQILTTNSQDQDVWITGFGNEITHTWESGDQVDVEITTKQGDNKTFYNFDLNNNSKPSPDKKLKLLQEIDRKIDLLLSIGNKPQLSSENLSNEQIGANNEVLASDLPF